MRSFLILCCLCITTTLQITFPVRNQGLYYKDLEKEIRHAKSRAFKRRMGRFDSSITLHDTIERRVQLPIVNLRNAEFTTTVSVGSPSKDLSLIIDTLSSNTWVYSKKCWSITCWWKDKYNPRFSTEEQKISNTKAKISYF